MKKRFLALFLVLLVLMLPVAGCQSQSFDGEAIVIEVDDVKVPLRIANFYARQQQAMSETYYASFFGEDMWSTEIEAGINYEQSVKASILEALENLYILDSRAAEFEVELSDEEVAQIERAAQAFVSANALEEKETVSGDLDTVKEYLRLRVVEAKMFEAMTVDVDKEVPDEEAAQKKMQYVMYVLSKTDEDGNAIEVTEDQKEDLKIEARNDLEEAKQADDLKAFAEEIDLYFNEMTFDTTTTSPNEELIQQAYALQVGEFTDIIETENGFFFGKLVSDFDQEATDVKKDSIVRGRQQESFNEQIAQWREETTITVHKSVWNKVSFQRVGVAIKQEPTESTTGQ